MPIPVNPIAAATHPNPYPYYADLLARRPLYHDPALGLWIAGGAQEVSAVLSSALCRVRPLAEPVPAALLDSPAADIFRRLVRMNDGADHCPLKQAVSATLLAIDETEVGAQSVRWAQVLCDELEPQNKAAHISAFAFHLPVYVVASLLGVQQDQLRQSAAWVNDFVRCIAAGADTVQIAKGKLAAGNLLDMFHAVLAQRQDGLLHALARATQGFGHMDKDAIVANGIGFLSQAYEATAGLIGNTLHALALHPEAGEQLAARPAFLPDVIQEVLRADPPIQNTRRYVAADGIVAGQAMKVGDAILVLLAAANHDPAANPSPERFELFRKQRQSFTFGLAAHACPGAALAARIAQAGVSQLLTAGVDLAPLAGRLRYRPSANARIPEFEGSTAP